jgi:hypothetical protein
VPALRWVHKVLKESRERPLLMHRIVRHLPTESAHSATRAGRRGRAPFAVVPNPGEPGRRLEVMAATRPISPTPR